MTFTRGAATAMACAMLALPAAAKDSKTESCGYQAQVVAAIQQARLDRVRERDVGDAIAKGNPTWPENYNNMIPIMVGPIYQKPMAELREENLGAWWQEQCLKQ